MFLNPGAIHGTGSSGRLAHCAIELVGDATLLLKLGIICLKCGC